MVVRLSPKSGSMSPDHAGNYVPWSDYQKLSRALEAVMKVAWPCLKDVQLGKQPEDAMLELEAMVLVHEVPLPSR